METLIRHLVLWRLIWVCVVFLCPTKFDARLIWVKKHIHKIQHDLYWLETNHVYVTVAFFCKNVHYLVAMTPHQVGGCLHLTPITNCFRLHQTANYSMRHHEAIVTYWYTLRNSCSIHVMIFGFHIEYFVREGAKSKFVKIVGHQTTPD